jgi:prephenate dehydrogenase
MGFKRIAIVGAGLIGSSFALAARRAGLARSITVWDRPAVVDSALSRGIADAVEDSFEAGRKCEADLVYLAAPVGAILEFLETKGKLLPAGAIVTDAGSTKREICNAAGRSLQPGVHFVGGHPMAGSHLQGLDHASAGLFEGAPYAIVAEDWASEEAICRMIEVVRSIGATPIRIGADDHDRIVAAVSHAPQLLSTAIGLTVLNGRDGGRVLDLAGNGFADMVRLAASRWSMWGDILKTNGDNIAPVLLEVSRKIEAFGNDLASGRLVELEREFGKASESAADFFSRARSSEFKL